MYEYVGASYINILALVSSANLFYKILFKKGVAVPEIQPDMTGFIWFTPEAIAMPPVVFQWSCSMLTQENYFADMILFMDNLMRLVICDISFYFLFVQVVLR